MRIVGMYKFKKDAEAYKAILEKGGFSPTLEPAGGKFAVRSEGIVVNVVAEVQVLKKG